MQQLEHQSCLWGEWLSRQREGNAKHHQHRHRSSGYDQPGDDRIRRAPHLSFPFFDLLLFEDRDEGRRKRSFTKQAAEEVRHLERQDKGARHRAAAHECRINHLANHPQHPAGQRRGGHCPGGF
jgi:hypothetical protein